MKDLVIHKKDVTFDKTGKMIPLTRVHRLPADKYSKRFNEVLNMKIAEGVINGQLGQDRGESAEGIEGEFKPDQHPAGDSAKQPVESSS